MYSETIGDNAGLIWKALEENGQMNFTALKKAAGINDKHLYLGIGWLAREDKIAFEQKKNQVLVDLKQ